MAFIAAVLFIASVALSLSLRIAQEYQRAVVFRFGRVTGPRGPGLFFLLPLVERSALVDLRVVTCKLDTQETVTRDGVAVKVNAVLWYRASNPVRVLVSVEDWHSAVKQAAETAMRDAIGQNELDHLLKDRQNANNALCAQLSSAVSKWGVEISAVELKDLDIPEGMQRAIAKEAEAVREKRARIIKAQGEMEAAAKLSDAALTMAATPGALELRRLQAITEIGAERNSTIVVAMPMDAVSAASSTIALARAGAN